MDVNRSSRRGGMTCLHFAAKEGKEDMVRVLKSLGADPERGDFKGRLPKQIADMYKHDKCSLLLL